MNDNDNNWDKFNLIPDYSLTINYLKGKNKEDINALIKDYNLLKKFKLEDIMTIINNYYDEDDKVKILRNEEFINIITSDYLELLLSNMKFISVFNMLQNITILNKVNSINVDIPNNDLNLITGYLDFNKLVLKTKSIMICNMLLKLNPEVLKEYLVKDYILTRLTKKEIMKIVLANNLKIGTYLNLDNLNNNELIDYYNAYLEQYKNIDQINNGKMVKRLLGLTDELIAKIDFDEVKYLYEYISSRSTITIQNNNHSVKSYKAIVVAYLLLGLKGTKKIMADGNKNLNFIDAENFIKELTNYNLYDYQMNNANLFDNMTLKIINILDDVKGLDYYNDDMLKSIIFNNEYLKNVASLVNIYNYGDIIEVFKNYLQLRSQNSDKAKAKLYTYIKGLIFNIYDTQKNLLLNKNKKRLFNSFEVKENVLYSQKKKIGQKYINCLKIKILINTLLGKDNHELYKNNFSNDEVTNKFNKLMEDIPLSYDNFVKNILGSMAMGIDCDYEILDHMNVKRPESFAKYQSENKEKEMVGKINMQIHHMFKNSDESTIKAILNYVCFGKKIDFVFDENILSTLKDLQNQIKNLNISVEISDNNLIVGKSFLLKQDFKLKNYVDYMKIIKKSVNKTYYFISHNIDTVKSLEKYSKEYHQYMDKIIVPVNLKHYNYVLKKRMFCLDDFTKFFGNFDFSNNVIMDESLIKYLIKNNIFSYYGDDFYQNNVDLLGYIISQWSEIKKYCLINKIDIYDLNLMEIQNILLTKIVNVNPVAKTLPYEETVALINYDNGNPQNNINKAIKKYENCLMSNDANIPNINFCLDNVECELVNKHNVNNLSLISLNNKFDYFKVRNIKSNEIVGFLSGYRKGNVYCFNDFKPHTNTSFNKIIKQISNILLQSTQNSEEPINFIALKSDNYQFGIKLDSKLIGEDDDEDCYIIMANDNINRNNFKLKKVHDNYVIKNNGYKIVNNFATKDDINNINAIIYLYAKNNNVDYKPININNYDKVVYGDNWVILIDKNINVLKLNNTYDTEIAQLLEQFQKNKTRLLQK